MIQNLIFKSIFLEIFFRAYNFCIFIHTFQRTSSEFSIISDCLAESLKASKNYRKISLILQYSFAQKTSLIYEPQLIWHLKWYALETQPKAFPNLQKIFQQTCFCLVSQKIFALHRFLTAKTAFLKHFESKCPFIAVYLRKKRRIKILSHGRREGGWEEAK